MRSPDSVAFGCQIVPIRIPESALFLQTFPDRKLLLRISILLFARLHKTLCVRVWNLKQSNICCVLAPSWLRAFYRNMFRLCFVILGAWYDQLYRPAERGIS